eukprot:SM000173S03012  [mRNA]  locus=s173:161487:165551:- [translate_table: standard]
MPPCSLRDADGVTLLTAPPGPVAPLPPLVKVACTAVHVSESGSLLAAVRASGDGGGGAVALYDPRPSPPRALAVLSAPGVAAVAISPLGSFVQTWQRPTSPDAKNLTLWDAATGQPLLQFFQKLRTPESWPSWQFSADERQACRVVRNEVHFFDGADLAGGIVARLRLPSVAAAQLAPSPPYHVAAYVPELKGAPASVRVYRRDTVEDGQPVARRSFFKSSSARFLWNKGGTAVLVQTHSDVDTTNKSYYGDSALHFLAADASYEGAVPLSQHSSPSLLPLQQIPSHWPSSVVYFLAHFMLAVVDSLNGSLSHSPPPSLCEKRVLRQGWPDSRRAMVAPRRLLRGRLWLCPPLKKSSCHSHMGPATHACCASSLRCIALQARSHSTPGRRGVGDQTSQSGLEKQTELSLSQVYPAWSYRSYMHPLDHPVHAPVMPAKAALFDTRCRILFDFGSGPRNTVCWNPQGRFICLAGFGNLPGDLEFWEKHKLVLLGKSKSACAVTSTWSPDGRYFLTATTAPRLQIDNGIKVFRYNGSLLYEQPYRVLYQADWLPEPPGTYPDRPASPVGSEAPGSTSRPAPTAPPAVKVAAYRPPMAGIGAADLQAILFGDANGSSASEGASRSAQKNKKKREKEKLKKDGAKDNNLDQLSEHMKELPAPSMSSNADSGGQASDGETAKRLRALQKKLGQIEGLKQKALDGAGIDALPPAQREKVAQEPQLREELASVEALLRS